VSRRRPLNHREASGGSPNRPAYTLLELVIVLSILASLAAITWPRLSPLLRRSSQRDAALQLTADLADAREQAIRSGEVRELYVYPGTGRYSIGPVAAEVDNPAAHADRRSNPSGQNAASTLSESGSELREWQDASTRELPDGVIFPRNDSPFDEDPESAGFLAAGLSATSATEDVGPDLSMDWSGDGVLAAQFFPDGRSTDTVVELTRPETRELLVLRLRGLTGGVTIGAVERPTPAAGSVSQELPSADADAPVEARR
jgi:prepilin-type N-terminal cleavage/methylation domain-containing protein